MGSPCTIQLPRHKTHRHGNQKLASALLSAQPRRETLKIARSLGLLVKCQENQIPRTLCLHLEGGKVTRSQYRASHP